MSLLMRSSPAALLLLSAIAMAAGDIGGYSVTARHAMPGEGGWDYLSHDAAHHRLYVTRGNRIQVLDSATGRLEAEIPDTAGVHGVALATDLGKGYASNGQGNSITAFDLQTLKTLAVIKPALAENPDFIT